MSIPRTTCRKLTFKIKSSADDVLSGTHPPLHDRCVWLSNFAVELLAGHVQNQVQNVQHRLMGYLATIGDQAILSTTVHVFLTKTDPKKKKNTNSYTCSYNPLASGSGNANSLANAKVSWWWGCLEVNLGGLQMANLSSEFFLFLNKGIWAGIRNWIQDLYMVNSHPHIDFNSDMV